MAGLPWLWRWPWTHVWCLVFWNHKNSESSKSVAKCPKDGTIDYSGYRILPLCLACIAHPFWFIPMPVWNVIICCSNGKKASFSIFYVLVIMKKHYKKCNLPTSIVPLCMHGRGNWIVFFYLWYYRRYCFSQTHMFMCILCMHILWCFCFVLFLSWTNWIKICCPNAMSM